MDIWQSLFHVGIPIVEKLIRTLAVYLFLVIGLRLAGKRELGQLNPFDLVVLLVLSNTVQNAIIGPDDSLLGGLVGAALLLIVNHLVVRWVYRRRWLGRLVGGGPNVLIREGKLITANMKRELITRAELEAAARKQGLQGLHEVSECRLEVGGALTFVKTRPDTEDARHRQLLNRLDALERHLAVLSANTELKGPSTH